MKPDKYKEAIERLQEMEKEASLSLSKAKNEKDWERVDRLRTESTACSMAASFLINDTP